jgi:hypothetical protein
MKPLYESLQLNFNTSKFGNALDPKNNMDEVVLYTQPLIRKWQYDAIVNDQTDRTLYLKNPLANVINTIALTANTIYLSTNTFLYLPNANSAVANLEIAANNFFRHTQRLSGVEVSTNLALPDFSMATGFGQQVLTVISKFESVTNNAPILGSMTSLFVEEDLLTYSADLSVAQRDLTNSIIFVAGLPGYYASNLSVTRINQIVQLIEDTASFMNTRRTHDVAFYGRVRNMANSINEISRFTAFNDLSAHLVEKYVGTDKLKNNL